jgi:Tfp pilus assembly protein FimT
MLRLRLHRRGLRSDEGLGLAEMIVTVGLTAVVGMFTFALLVQGIRSTAGTAVRQDDAGQARIAIEAMSRNLRAAISPAQIQGASCTSGCDATTGVTAASPDAITFYANVNADGAAPSRVTYRVVGSTLEETVQAPTVSGLTYSFCSPGASCPVRTRTLVRGLVAPTPAAPLFQYLREDGFTPQTFGTPATAVELGNIDSVEILARVSTSAKWKTPPTSVTMRVALPNADYARPAPVGGS